ENAKADGKTVRVVDGKASPGRFVRPAGLDYKAGDVLLRRGHRLTARDIGLLAAGDLAELSVTRKPRVAVIATGDELSRPGPRAPTCW
ncbi:MAG TPA: molybdopterin molybdenumtransferase MoeA, partial [Alphaproteobacteria bacterium]